MHWLMSLLLASVTLGAGFDGAAASATPADDGTMTLDLQVEVGDAATVVAHLLDVGGDQQTVTLGADDDGTYRGRVVTERANFIVVFEALYADGTGRASSPANLLELGVDPEILGLEPPPLPDDEITGFSAATTRWIWIAIALTALSLALTALWAAGPKPAQAGTRPRRQDQEVR